MRYSDYNLNMITGCNLECNICNLKDEILNFSIISYKKNYRKLLKKVYNLDIIFHEQEYFAKLPENTKYIDCSYFTEPSIWNDFQFMLLNEKAKIYSNKIFILTTRFPIKLIGRKFENNIWIALSCTNQTKFELGIESLRHIDTSKRVVIFEPISEEIKYTCDFNNIDWAIIGQNKSAKISHAEIIRTISNLKTKNIPVFVNSLITKNGITTKKEEFPIKLQYKEYPL